MSAPANPVETASAAAVTRDPQKLAALCELWKADNRVIWLTLTGYSMAPAVMPGSQVKVECGVAATDLAAGDIVAFRQEGSLVIHRLIAVEGPSRFICKGDANPSPDPPVEAHEIVGLVVEIRPPALLVRLRKRIGHLLLLYRRRARIGSQSA